MIGLIIFNFFFFSLSSILIAKPEIDNMFLADPQTAIALAGSSSGLGFIAAAIAVGLGAIAAGIAVAITGSAAIGAITEKPERLGQTLIFVGLAEGVAIYGLIIAIMILGKI